MSVGVVTGAARGMGLACARRVASTVDVLFVVDRDEEGVQTVAAELGGSTRTVPFALDVTDDGVGFDPGDVGQYGKFPPTVVALVGRPQSSGFGRLCPGTVLGLSRIIWFTIMRCTFIAERIWVKKSAVRVHSTSTESDGSIPICCILIRGGMPCRMFISIGKAIET